MSTTSQYDEEDLISSLEECSKHNSKEIPNEYKEELESKLQSLIEEIKSLKQQKDGYFVNSVAPHVYPQQSHNLNQGAAQNSQRSNNVDDEEIKRLRKKIFRMEDRMYDMEEDERNRAMQQPPMPPQQQDKTMYYLLLIIGSAAFCFIPILGIPILAGAIGMSCGFKETKNVESYLTAVHQNQHLRDQEIRDLRYDLRSIKEGLSR